MNWVSLFLRTVLSNYLTLRNIGIHIYKWNDEYSCLHLICQLLNWHIKFPNNPSYSRYQRKEAINYHTKNRFVWIISIKIVTSSLCVASSPCLTSWPRLISFSRLASCPRSVVGSDSGISAIGSKSLSTTGFRRTRAASCTFTPPTRPSSGRPCWRKPTPSKSFRTQSNKAVSEWST